MDMNRLFDLVAKEGASDLLISAGAPPVLRVNGKLIRTKGASLTPEQAKKLIYGHLDPDQKKTFEENRELWIWTSPVPGTPPR